MPEPYIPKPPVAPDDAPYLSAALAEAEFWSRPQIYSIDAWWGAALGPIKRYYNRRLTGDERTPWYEMVARRGPFRRGLVLGSGGMVQEAGILETNPGLHLTFCDIDASGLASRAEAFGARFPARVETRQIDLNFAALEPARYDVIISANTLHHIVNLEHVAAQIAAALADDGWFFLYDYTGESGMRFPAEQKRVFELIYERERARNPRLPAVAWHDVSDGTYSPFEAVRGGETIDILRQHLDEVDRRTVGAVLGLLFFAGLLEGTYDAASSGVRSRIRHALRRSTRAPSLVWEEMLSTQCFRELALLDELACDAELFRPNNTFAVYRKRA